MCGESGVPSAVGIVEDLLPWLRRRSGFQVEVLVYPVTRDRDGRDVEGRRTRPDLTDDQAVRKGRYPDSMRAREL